MKQFVRRTGGRIGLWGGLLAAALAAFAAGWLVPARAPVGCNLNELTAAPDFSPFSLPRRRWLHPMPVRPPLLPCRKNGSA